MRILRANNPYWMYRDRRDAVAKGMSQADAEKKFNIHASWLDSKKFEAYTLIFRQCSVLFLFSYFWYLAGGSGYVFRAREMQDFLAMVASLVR